MKNLPLLLAAAALLFSCNEKPEEQRGFTLTGHVKNVPDSTMVVMSRNNIDLDSAMVMDEKFRFSGEVEEPYSVFLMFSGIGEYTTLWLENSDIELSAEKGNMRDRVVTGSEIQKEDDLLDERIKPFQQARDSAFAVLREENISEARRDSVSAFLRDLRKREIKVTQEFVRENPQTVVGTYILNFYKTTWGREVTEELYADLPAERRDSKDGKMIAYYLEINKDPEVGEQYADFEMKNAEGESVKLSELRGKYTLLYFWAAHCGPSRQENPNLVKNYETFKDRGFELVGVSIDADPKVFSGSIQEHNLTWTNLMSPEGRDNDAGLIYGINGTPDNFLIDEQGTIIARNIRGEELTRKLEELL
jgi:peroxiredoxin